MGTAFTYCVPSSYWRLSIIKRKSKSRVTGTNTMSLNELPRKALKQIFGYLSQTERQRNRVVCKFWNSFIIEGFPVELVITQLNYERLFKCPNAVSAEIRSLTLEYTGNISFGDSVRSIRFSGKVLSSNLINILRYCRDLESLCFSSLKNVLGIEGVESVKLPTLHTIEFIVRPDQETFTADEIIVISVLRQIIFGSLKTLLINTKTTYDLDWDDDDDDEDGEEYSDSTRVSPEETRSFSVSSMSSDGFPTTEAGINPIGQTPVIEEPRTVPETNTTESEGTQTAAPPGPNTNLHVIINRAANFANASGSNAATVQSSSHASTVSSSRRVRRNISDFEERLFYVNLEMMMESEAESTVLNVLNDSRSRTQLESVILLDMPGITVPALNHTVFFEFVKNNCATLKNFMVKTRSDFTCFGNLTSFSRDLPKVQFEDVEYSFGRMQLCQEHHLLREQRKLEKIKMQILDDMWRHVMFAVDKSQSTLQEIDIKVLSVGDDHLNISPILACPHLKCLKLLHFYEKENLSRLPRSLNKLVLNGPVTYGDMTSWTRDLQDLTDLTLLLNVRGDKIDLKLFKKFVKMRNMCRLTFIQCPIALDEIQVYFETTLKTQKGIKFWFSGPRELRDIPSIQYVYTLINPDEFDREQVTVEE